MRSRRLRPGRLRHAWRALGAAACLLAAGELYGHGAEPSGDRGGSHSLEVSGGKAHPEPGPATLYPSAGACPLSLNREAKSVAEASRPDAGASASAREAGESPDDPLSPEAVSAFLDPIVEKAMRDWHIPGAAVAIVKGDRVLVSRGYGYSDLERKIAVSPSETLFRMGSVSKVVTATAVMQLVDRGLLDLDADVNRYLRAPLVPPTFPEPVTAAHLLTHTAGFEERLSGTASPTPAGVLPGARYLARSLPRRVVPPGEFVIYSNQGYTLLGELVAEISGTTFEAYAERNLRAARHGVLPIRDPGRGPLALLRAPRRGIRTGALPRRGLRVQRRELQDRAAGLSADRSRRGLISTAEDMTRFMKAQLHLGRLGQRRILSEATERSMQRQHFTHHPGLPGLAYGFFESFYFNRRSIYRLGGIRGFSSLFYLLPDEDLGIFVVNNGYQEDLGWEVADAFLKQYFPGAPPEAAPPVGFRERAGLSQGATGT